MRQGGQAWPKCVCVCVCVCMSMCVYVCVSMCVHVCVYVLDFALFFLSDSEELKNSKPLALETSEGPLSQREKS